MLNLSSKQQILLIYLFIIIPISLILGQVATSINIFLIFLFMFFNFKEIKNYLYPSGNYTHITFLLIFFLYLIFSALLISDHYHLKQLLILKFFFIFVFVMHALERFKKTIIQKYSFLLICIFFFLAFDLIFQKILGKDIFGFYSTGSNINRLTGPFGINEHIPGSYIFFMCMPFLFIFFFKKNNSFLKIFFIFSSLSLIFLTGERMSFLMSSIFVILLMVLLKKERKYILIGLVIFCINMLILSKVDTYYTERYRLFMDYLIKNEKIENNDGVISREIKSQNNYPHYFNNPWAAHYLTSIEIFKNYPLFGSGVRSFRYECKKKNYEIINSSYKHSRCSTHPHNFYLEVLSETGLVGFTFFCMMIIFVLLRYIYSLFSPQKKIDIYKVTFFSFALVIFFPFKSTGSIFSNFYGLIFWFNFALIYFFSNNKNYSN